MINAAFEFTAFILDNSLIIIIYIDHPVLQRIEIMPAEWDDFIKFQKFRS